MLKVLVTLQLCATGAADRLRARLSDERGQSTAEYALVLLGAAAVAMLLVGWAGKTDKIGKLLNGVVDQVMGKVG
ncbi:MAG: DUF4244 domain-containing protein [Acidimicrobiia bacterium]